MCNISTSPPWLSLVGPLQAPINWLLFTVVTLVLLHWFTQAYTYNMNQHTSHVVGPRQLPSLLIATYAILLFSSFLIFIVAPPSLLLLDHWFQSQATFLGHVCNQDTNQYIALNTLAAQYSHIETFLGLLASGGLIIALACMRRYLRDHRVQDEQPSLSYSRSLSRNVTLALGFLIATSVIYALSPALEGPGCDQSCGFGLLFVRLIGSLIGDIALLMLLVALIRGFFVLIKGRQWNWLVGLLLLLTVSVGFFLSILSGPKLSYYDPSFFFFFPFTPFLNPPQIALIFTALTILPAVLLLSPCSISKQNKI